MKLWQKDKSIDNWVEAFTIGNDAELDLELARYDVLGNMAHCIMLESIGLLKSDEKKSLLQELRNIYQEIISPNSNFKIEEGVEDIHSQIELMLTNKLGDVGKKIHAARSRNDQVLVDLKLFFRQEILDLKNYVYTLFEKFIQLSNQYQNQYLPGYTHFQVAMPSSFGLWFGAYAESLIDDVETLLSAFHVANKNPLGSAAGYGSSFPINRSLTTQLLGFKQLNYNVVYAQMGRGKTERILAQALANIADTLGKFSMDVCLYLSQDLGFISFPAELTTGSSIMPHKKNPDVFELVRGHCNQIKSLPNELTLMTSNLPSGYHRDFQLLKTHLFPAITQLKKCIEAIINMLDHIEVKSEILKQEKYQYVYSVEEVNKLVLQGMPFRDAYRKVGMAIENNEFSFEPNINHIHEGSIGNLMNDEIHQNMKMIMQKFDEEKINHSVQELLNH